MKDDAAPRRFIGPMKAVFFRCVWFLVLGVCLAYGQETHVAPTPAIRPDPARFAEEIAKLEKQEPVTGGIVFAGSSSIRLWTRLKEDFPDLPVVNCGFGGSTANDLIVYFEKTIARHVPKLMVIYTGGNDINFQLTVDEAFDDYTRFLGMAHERFPDTRVILTSVKIAPKRAEQMPKIHEFNKRLETWTRDKSWVRFLDCTSYLADASGQPIETMYRADRLHLSPVGYAHWLILLDPVLREEWAKVR